jgi:ribosomal protein S18 acetylase RimI-like enzyme
MAWQEGHPVGLAAGLQDAGERDAGEAWHLVSMWVSPQARGSGVADGLVEAVCACARASGAALIELWVTDVNARAWAFYRRLGLASAGTRQLVRPEEPDHWEEQLVRQLA